jgi:hypothetical protein
VSAPARPSGARGRSDGLRLIPAGPGAENAFRAIRGAMAEAAVCNACRDAIAGAVWVSARTYYCGACAQADLSTLARARPLSECAQCGRPIVVVARDGRVRHDVCSPGCRAARRAAERRGIHEQRVCPYCATTFISRRADQRFCGSRCRVRAYKEGKRA